jgi:hypothetical protein
MYRYLNLIFKAFEFSQGSLFSKYTKGHGSAQLITDPYPDLVIWEAQKVIDPTDLEHVFF